MSNLSSKIAASVILDDSETAMDWIRLWMAVKNVEGESASFEDGCKAWFRMQNRQKKIS